MKKVDYFSVQVGYTKSFDDYSVADFMAMARAKMDAGIDCYEKSEILDDELAAHMDGHVEVGNMYPCNKIALVTWAFIDDQYDADEQKDITLTLSSDDMILLDQIVAAYQCKAMANSYKNRNQVSNIKKHIEEVLYDDIQD